MLLDSHGNHQKSKGSQTKDQKISQPTPLNKQPKLRILVLCTGNSARSIIAEALFSTIGAEFFEAHSAGSCPTGKVNPYALEQIKKLDYFDTPRSKSWNEFSDGDALNIDIVVTVCGNAASEVCPVFPGQPKKIHWGVPDPAAEQGTNIQKQQAFLTCFNVFKGNIHELVSEVSSTDNADVHKIMARMEMNFESLNASVSD